MCHCDVICISLYFHCMCVSLHMCCHCVCCSMCPGVSHVYTSMHQELGTSGSLPFTDQSHMHMLQQKPTLKDLLSLVVQEVAPKWWKLGLLLDIDPVVIEIIQSGSNVNVKVDALCQEMFQKWLNEDRLTGSAPRTWRSVVEAVRSGHGEAAAEEIEQKLGMYSN